MDRDPRFAVKLGIMNTTEYLSSGDVVSLVYHLRRSRYSLSPRSGSIDELTGDLSD